MPAETRPFNFGALPDDQSSYDRSRVVVLPVPYDATVSLRSGAREGPAAIIRASRGLETYDEEFGIEICQEIGIHTLGEIVPNHKSPRDQVERISHVASRILRDGKYLVSLGGEHSITSGIVAAHLDHYPDLTVLQLDAHPDLRDSYEGTPYNHACVMRRVAEICPFVQVGVRCVSRAEDLFIRESGIPSISARRWSEDPEVVAGEVLAALSGEVYVTIDLDVFDPSEMPAVGTPEPGGAGWYQVIGLLRKVAAARRIVGFDLVELSPIPGMIAPDFFAARLVYKLINMVFVGNRYEEVSLE